jgi:hypothetical protein
VVDLVVADERRAGRLYAVFAEPAEELRARGVDRAADAVGDVAPDPDVGLLGTDPPNSSLPYCDCD